MNNLSDKLNNLKNDYYKTNTKKFLFKNQQKTDCATNIVKNFDLQALINNTVYNINNSNNIYFDYTLFKQYTYNDIMDNIVTYTINLISDIIHKFGDFHLHINMDTYSVSAHERYKNIFHIFHNSCMKHELAFDNFISSINIYNTPAIITNLIPFFKSLMGENATKRITLYDKKYDHKHIFNI